MGTKRKGKEILHGKEEESRAVANVGLLLVHSEPEQA